jgi:hypothetical protein
VVDALERIHAALDDGGLVADTQPVSPHPPVFAGDEHIGALDMREWGETIRAVDREITSTVERGLFSVRADTWVVVPDVFDDLEQLIETAADWRGTRVPDELAAHAGSARGPVRLDQRVRLRVLVKQ